LNTDATASITARTNAALSLPVMSQTNLSRTKDVRFSWATGVPSRVSEKP